MEPNFDCIDMQNLDDEKSQKFNEPCVDDYNNFDKEKSNYERFVLVFDQIFNRSNCFSQSNTEEDGEDEKSMDLRNNYFEKKMINEEECINSNSNINNNSSNNISLEEQLKNNISSLSDENIVMILKELYFISDNGKIFKYKYNSLLLAKKLIEELKSRVNQKFQKLLKY